ncbi:hypothetical protein J3D55_001123 [Chryseobacterium ginsenosidimutans]|nr:hypothetical protein [Chryseobacterium ginsenosidimutans]
MIGFLYFYFSSEAFLIFLTSLIKILMVKINLSFTYFYVKV